MKNKMEYRLLRTPWGESLTGMPWNVYPRPQMQRDSFFCLNGEWDFSAEGVVENAKICSLLLEHNLLLKLIDTLGLKF